VGLGSNRQRATWLVDIHAGGPVLRYASRPVSVTTAAGDVLDYAGGLAPLTLGSARALGRQSVPLTILSDLDWALQVARGLPLDGRRAVVRLWLTGQTLEAADVYITGFTERSAYGPTGTALTTTVVADPAETSLWLPPPQAVADARTWPVTAGRTLPAVMEGQRYPIPIGVPGHHVKPGAPAIPEAAVPAVYVERNDPTNVDERWVIALGRIAAAQVTLYNISSPDLDRIDLVPFTTTDLLGQTVTVVETGSLADATDEYAIGFQDTSGWGGGVISPFTGAAMDGAGEVARWALEYFTDATIDAARMVAVQDWLDRFRVSTYIQPRVNVARWLEDSILPLLPVIGVDGPDGYYLAPLRWDATATDAIAHLDADGRQVARDGQIRTWDEPIENLLTLDYRPILHSASDRPVGYASRRVLSSVDGELYAAAMGGPPLPPIGSMLPWQATSVRDDRILGSALCQWSQPLYGVREWAGDAPWVWDDATAQLILQYRALRSAYPKRAARYTGGLELRTLLPGDVVTLTDSEVGISSRVALVIERTTSVSEIAIDLVLLDHPLQTARRIT